MSGSCSGCHRGAPPGEEYCPGCRRRAENRTLDAFTDDEEKAITEEEAADAVRYALSHAGVDTDTKQ